MKEVILAGRPNSGKSTLFNRMANANQKVANYAGCTVEKKTASVIDGETTFDLTDLPGVYSLKANSLDEEVALRHLEEKKGSLVVFVVDGNNLEQELILPLLLKKQGHEVAIAVNMMDEVRANRRILDLAGMSDLAGIPFFPVSARLGEGVEALKKFVSRYSATGASGHVTPPSVELHREARSEARRLGALNQGGNQVLRDRDARIDNFLLHRFLGPVVFLFAMFVVFQSIFTWAAPLSDGVEAGIGWLQEFTKTNITHELAASLLADGVLAGIGAVLVFVPQIAILFLLIGLLEYSGYLPRVAYMVDRLMKPYGLDGKVFIPLLSSVACAVPGIMATRTIESQRTRLITILISPLMTCSARLPVYTLLISTFIPQAYYGIFSLQGLVMFGMYALAVVVALLVALVLHKLHFHKQKHLVDFIHLPRYRMPNWPELFRFVWTRVSSFLKKAGTIIAAMAILLWMLLSFPQVSTEEITAANPGISAEELEAKSSALQLQESYGGRLGQFLEPVFRPIGYDWKLTIGIVASLAAREVFVSTLGTVFALGEVDEHSEGLSKTLLESKDENGQPLYTLATCVSLLVFFAFSLQCISTLGVAKRETNSWKIPLFMFGYMFLLAYGTAFFAFHLTRIFWV